MPMRTRGAGPLRAFVVRSGRRHFGHLDPLKNLKEFDSDRRFRKYVRGVSCAFARLRYRGF